MLGDFNLVQNNFLRNVQLFTDALSAFNWTFLCAAVGLVYHSADVLVGEMVGVDGEL